MLIHTYATFLLFLLKEMDVQESKLHIVHPFFIYLLLKFLQKIIGLNDLHRV